MAAATSAGSATQARAVASTCAPCAWIETPLATSPASCAAVAVAAGRSVMTVPGFMSDGERKILLQSAAETASWPEEQPAMEPLMPGRQRLHVPSRLNASAQALSEEILRRGLAFVQAHAPSMGETMLQCSAADLTDMPDDPGLEFSPGEPAVNVYTQGGEFKAHEDKRSLTILVLLSEPDAFAGGGTAFWPPGSQDQARRGEAPPAVTLKPPAGTAILFGGEVTHAAVPVKAGTRCVWVASFSPAWASSRRGNGCCARPRDASGGTAIDATGARAVDEGLDLEALLQAIGI